MDNFPLNIEIFRFVNSHHNPGFDVFFQCVRWLGTGYVMIPLLVLAHFYRKPKVNPLLIAFAIESLIVTLLKHWIVQPRPASAGIGAVHLLQNLHKGSFPSGDVAMAAMIAFVMSRGETRLFRIVWYLYVLLIAYERMYLGVHFPLDVTAGAAIGILCSYLTCLCIKSGEAKTTQASAT
jgi:undecaprenyl-diphosphatase